MQEIILTLLAAAIISILCDCLIAGTSMKKYARLGIGIAVSTMLVIPIVEFVTSEEYQEITMPTIESGYIDIVDSQYITVLNLTAQSALAEKGITATVYCTIEEYSIASVVVVAKSVQTQAEAEEIGYAVCEILSVPLYMVKVRSE